MRHVILYTMKGCPHCSDMKEMLDENNVIYSERDIDEYEEEYNLFVEATDNEFIPAFMLLELDLINEEIQDKPKQVKLLAPDRDFQELEEALELVKRFLN